LIGCIASPLTFAVAAHSAVMPAKAGIQ